MPPRIFISVDLPAPFSPTSATTSAGRASSETLLSATTPGNRLLIPRISSNGVVVRFIQIMFVQDQLRGTLGILIYIAFPRDPRGWSLCPNFAYFDLAPSTQLIDLHDEIIDAFFFDRQRRNDIQFALRNARFVAADGFRQLDH